MIVSVIPVWYSPTMDRKALDDLGERIAEQAAHLDAAMHTLLVDIREFDEKGGYDKQGARSCAQWLAWRVGWGSGASREHVRGARALATVPGVPEPLRGGGLSD